jgi:hypothetical protein
MVLRKLNKSSSWITAIAAILISVQPSTVLAGEAFDNKGIEFDQNTVVEFEVSRSNPANQYVFGVINLKTGEKTALFPQTSERKIAEFKFLANTPYAFYLESYSPSGSIETALSTDAQNPGQTLQVLFEGGLSSLTNQTGVRLGWNDARNPKAKSFNDFVVVAGGFQGCPCKTLPTPISGQFR